MTTVAEALAANRQTLPAEEVKHETPVWLIRRKLKRVVPGIPGQSFREWTEELLELGYEAEVVGFDGITRRLPMTHPIGAANQTAPGTRNPLGQAILELLQYYEKLKSERDQALRERDAALHKVEAVLKDKRKG